MNDGHSARIYVAGYLAGVEAAIRAAAGREAGQSYDLHERIEALLGLLTAEEREVLTDFVEYSHTTQPPAAVVASLQSKGFLTDDGDPNNYGMLYLTEAGHYMLEGS